MRCCKFYSMLLHMFGTPLVATRYPIPRTCTKEIFREKIEEAVLVPKVYQGPVPRLCTKLVHSKLTRVCYLHWTNLSCSGLFRPDGKTKAAPKWLLAHTITWCTLFCPSIDLSVHWSEHEAEPPTCLSTKSKIFPSTVAPSLTLL